MTSIKSLWSWRYKVFLCILMSQNTVNPYWENAKQGLLQFLPLFAWPLLQQMSNTTSITSSSQVIKSVLRGSGVFTLKRLKCTGFAFLLHFLAFLRFLFKLFKLNTINTHSDIWCGRGRGCDGVGGTGGRPVEPVEPWHESIRIYPVYRSRLAFNQT